MQKKIKISGAGSGSYACFCYGQTTVCAACIRLQLSDGPYLEYVSLVEAEFIAFCGTKCVKCHCFHAENFKHTHMHAYAPTQANSDPC